MRSWNPRVLSTAVYLSCEEVLRNFQSVHSLIWNLKSCSSLSVLMNVCCYGLVKKIKFSSSSSMASEGRGHLDQAAITLSTNSCSLFYVSQVKTNWSRVKWRQWTILSLVSDSIMAHSDQHVTKNNSEHEQNRMREQFTVSLVSRRLLCVGIKFSVNVGLIFYNYECAEL